MGPGDTVTKVTLPTAFFPIYPDIYNKARECVTYVTTSAPPFPVAGWERLERWDEKPLSP
jgi:hypothetical protein